MMSGIQPKLMRYVSWPFQLLLSIYIAIFVVNRESLRDGSKLLDWLGAPLLSFDRLFSHLRGGRLLLPRNCVQLELRVALYCFLALILFVCLRLVSLGKPGRALVHYVAVGCLAVGSFLTPAFQGRYLQANGFYEYTDAGHLHLVLWLRGLEVVLLLVFLSLWLIRRWPMKVPVLLFATHFSFWGLIIVGQDWQQCELAIVEYLLLPFVASLTWVWPARSSAGPWDPPHSP
jgi:hypothetical protein